MLFLVFELLGIGLSGPDSLSHSIELLCAVVEGHLYGYWGIGMEESVIEVFEVKVEVQARNVQENT